MYFINYHNKVSEMIMNVYMTERMSQNTAGSHIFRAVLHTLSVVKVAVLKHSKR
jgi:hypothetical protein